MATEQADYPDLFALFADARNIPAHEYMRHVADNFNKPFLDYGKRQEAAFQRVFPTAQSFGLPSNPAAAGTIAKEPLK